MFIFLSPYILTLPLREALVFLHLVPRGGKVYTLLYKHKPKVLQNFKNIFNRLQN